MYYPPRRYGDIIPFVSKSKGANAFAEVYAIVKRIPRGRVMNYGQIARLLKKRLSARGVGWALHQCPEGLPWQRVVNVKGECSSDKLGSHPSGLQKALLEEEGVEFGVNETIDMEKHRWCPDSHYSPPKRKKK